MIFFRNFILLIFLFSLVSSSFGTEYLIQTDGTIPEIANSKDAVIEKVTKNVFKVTVKGKLILNKISSNILHIEKNQTWSIIEGEEDETKNLWGLFGANGINVKKAWQVSTGSKDLVVAVIDTGIDYTHPDLKANMWTNKVELNGEAGKDDDGNGYVDDIYGYDFANKDGDPMDGNGHGTHCAGTIGAVHNGIGVMGVMKDVKLIGIKFLTDRGSGSTDGAIQAIDYAIKMGANVMSNSWGGGAYSKLLGNAIKRANAASITFVAASGNSNSDNDLIPHYPSNYKIDNVISVASHSSSGSKSYFSCYGKETVDISAPGSSIKSTWKDGGYKSISGTSMATPHVSGVVGLMLTTNPALSPLKIKNKLIQSVVKKDNFKDKTVSEGIVDAFSVLNTPLR